MRYREHPKLEVENFNTPTAHTTPPPPLAVFPAPVLHAYYLCSFPHLTTSEELFQMMYCTISINSSVLCPTHFFLTPEKKNLDFYNFLILRKRGKVTY